MFKDANSLYPDSVPRGNAPPSCLCFYICKPSRGIHMDAVLHPKTPIALSIQHSMWTSCMLILLLFKL